MLNSPVLDLVILLSFTYFIGSLLLSTINESISEGIFRLRKRNLQYAIENLFFNEEWKNFVKKEFVFSPHISSLAKTKGDYPAYIPNQSFFLAVFEKLEPDNLNNNQLIAAIDKATLPNEFKLVLKNIAQKSQNNLVEFEKGVNFFYENAMDRAGGWYKKQIKRILLALGFVIAVCLNIDTLDIAKEALKDKKSLKESADKIVANMEKFVKADNTATQVVKIDNESGKIIFSSSPINDTLLTNAGISRLNDLRIEYEHSSSIKLGYDNFEDFLKQWRENFFLKLIGVIVTAFALQLGSNYWFDMINKVINIRSAGKKPQSTN